MKKLITLWPETAAQYANISVQSLSLDSREVSAGALFFALKGASRDARDFIEQVIAAGAVAVLAEQDSAWPHDKIMNGVPVIVVRDLAQKIGGIAAEFFNQPAKNLTVFAVTGTNGKTSVSNLIAGALTQLHKKSAVLGTLGNGFYGELSRSTHTTLDAYSVQKKLAEFAEKKAEFVALEASSHGLQQGRLNGTDIRVAIFTNLTRDHLDYHGSMAQYAAAKEILFKWPALHTAILNLDDAAATQYRAALHKTVRVFTYSQSVPADFFARQVQPSLAGLNLRIATPAGEVSLQVPLLGRFNVSNILAVFAALYAVDFSVSDIVRALTQASPVQGRMQSFIGEHPTVVVDYAHTPDALEKVLSSLREHAQQKLICVFGCGGDRDSGKRPQMGEISARLADKTIITTDNPRSENPENIIADIRAGIVAGVSGETVAGVSDEKNTVVDFDRHSAIKNAVLNAQRNDIVLVAGKGHEDYQEINGVRHYFSDADEVSAALAQWRAA